MDAPTSWRRRSTSCSPLRRRAGAGDGLVTYSPKVFIPLTTLCRDVCGYCTFARPPRRGERAYLTEDEVLAIARAGAAAGCTEALFTLGDKPELRYRVARDELADARLRDHDRVPRADVAARVLEETGLLPHLNPGVMTPRRARAAPAGLRVDGDHARDDLATGCSKKGGPHWASPDKRPGGAARDDATRRASCGSRSRAGS